MLRPVNQDPYQLAAEAADFFRSHFDVDRIDVALVLGSGWGGAADLIGETRTVIDNADVPGFSRAAVVGHSGTIRSVSLGDTDRRALVYGTRTHFYEGKGVRAVVHGVRTAAAAGCRQVVLTNGCGGLRPEWPAGTPVLISDHLNLTAASPLEGATFVDLTDLYSSRLRGIAREVDASLDEGVYVQFRGPHYETPAEVRMARTLGGDLVGMSTTLEAIAARHAGLEILGISLVTNHAAGISETPLAHDEVVAAGHAAAERCGEPPEQRRPVLQPLGDQVADPAFALPGAVHREQARAQQRAALLDAHALPDDHLHRARLVLERDEHGAVGRARLLPERDDAAVANPAAVGEPL